MTLTMTDMFCGAGGSSTGALAVPGIEVRTAMNHWARAIETHNTNHPDATHIQADISITDPRYVAHSDILWASPECTNHSPAKGRKRLTNQPDLFGESIADEAADRSRATMWDVPRFAEVHDYRLIITENVVDAAKWVMFPAWLHAMDSLGYEHHIVYMNSMHAQAGGLPAPQSRDRMYVMFWKKGNKAPDFNRLRPKAYCPSCDETVDAMQSFKRDRWGRYRSQYLWRCPKGTCRSQIIEPGWLPAAHAIDWSIRGQRIGDRAKPLAEKTMRRIEAGLAKYGAQSMQLSAAGNTYDSAGGKPGNYYRIWPTAEALRTQTGTQEHGLLMPLIVNNLSGSDSSRTDLATEPLRTLVAGGRHASLLVPVEGRDGKQAQAIHEAMRTQTTRNETGILTLPALLMRNNSSRRDGAEMSTPVHEVMRTLTTAGHQSLIEVPEHARAAFVVTMRGANAPKGVAQPLDTFAANGTHHGLASPQSIDVEDCEFRMLEPHEIMAGMAFPKEYVMTGNKREQVKQSGNAVTPPAARDLISIGAEALA